MGAYICQICDNMFCSHEVNYYSCDICGIEACESCWEERSHEDQNASDPICGECYRKKAAAAAAAESD